MNFTSVLAALGPIAMLIVFAMVFIENGLLLPFLPGDSLVFAAAILAAKLGVPWYVVVIIAVVGAVVGAETGFAIGRHFGRRLFTEDARPFKQRYLDDADAFFARYGRASIVMARFIPIVRTYISPAMGISHLAHATFARWNLLGAVAWGTILGVAGFFLGKIPVVANNIDVIAVVIVLISVLPVVIAALTKRRARRKAESAAVSS